MSKKLKIILASLVLLGGFLLTRIGLFIKESLDRAVQVRGVSTVEEVENPFKKDTDNDGISDSDEAYYRTDPFKADTDRDGYLDGEEIISGCNPTIPSDDCNLSTGAGRLPKNVTEHFGNLMFGGLLSSDLKKDSPSSSGYLSFLIDEAFKARSLLLTVDDSNSEKISTNDSRSAQEYLNVLEDALLKYFFINKNLTDLDSLNFENFDFSPYIHDLGQLYKELSEISPPQDWVQTHGKFLRFVLKLKNYFLSLDGQDQDPLKVLLAFSNSQSLLSEYEEIMREIGEKIKTADLKTEVFVYE